jgi:hypothetical protein
VAGKGSAPSSDNITHFQLVIFHFGPSEVPALPLAVAAKCSIHYFRDYFSFLSMPKTFLAEGVVLEF